VHRTKFGVFCKYDALLHGRANEPAVEVEPGLVDVFLVALYTEGKKGGGE
jgi:hypothetical protein